MKRNRNTQQIIQNGDGIVIKRIPINVLISDQAYQRVKLNGRVVKNIVDNFDELLLDPLRVSYLDGRYYVYDGQHRLAALKRVYEGRAYSVPCRVDRLLPHEQARFFATQNKNKAPQTAYHDHVGMVAAGDPDAVNLENVLQKLNLSMGGGRGHRVVSCAERMRDMSRRDTPDDIYAKLSLIVSTWDGDAVSLSTNIVGGVSVFYDTFKDEINAAQFAEALGRVNPLDIIRDGKSDHNTKNRDMRFAKSILNYYNYKRKNRLPISRFNG